MKFILIAALVGITTAFVDLAEWNDFKTVHVKSYHNSIEELHHMQVYADSKAFVARHNAEYALGKHTFTVALNQFADLTSDDVNALHKGYSGRSRAPRGVHQPSGQEAPGAIDWRDQGVVTPVKDQGECGACWAFSSTGALESAWALAGHALQTLSEQQLVDCSEHFHNDGCSGGMMDQAYRYLEAEGGIMSEEDYLYTAADGGTCRADPARYVASMTSHVDVMAAGSEPLLVDAVASVGPVSVSIDASQRSFRLYSGGVYSEPACSAIWLDHGVLAVGYGSENGTDYWLVKNSWGADWGEDGYIRMIRDGSNQCGIASEAVYPVV